MKAIAKRFHWPLSFSDINTFICPEPDFSFRALAECKNTPCIRLIKNPLAAIENTELPVSVKRGPEFVVLIYKNLLGVINDRIFIRQFEYLGFLSIKFKNLRPAVLKGAR